MPDTAKDYLHTLAARARDVTTLIVAIGMVMSIFLIWGSDSERAKRYFRNLVGMADFEITQKQAFTELADAQTALTRKIDEFIDIQAQTAIDAATEAKARADAYNSLDQRLRKLEDVAKDMTPALQFLEDGSSISDGRIGGLVSISYSFIKVRDCGRPMPDDFFVDANGVRFRFLDVSLLDNQGRGTSSPPNPALKQTLRYTARIPSDRGVVPGKAQGWVVVQNYEACPWLAPVIGPRMDFNILPEE